MKDTQLNIKIDKDFKEDIEKHVKDMKPKYQHQAHFVRYAIMKQMRRDNDK